MRRWLQAGVAGLSVAVLSTAGSGTALASPARVPVAPAYSVTATLDNNTACTLTLTGGTLFAGELTQEPPAVIGPDSTGTWRNAGYNAFTEPDADAVVVYAVSGCPQGGGQEGYETANSSSGTFWGDGACAAVESPLLHSFYSGVSAYHATVTIDLDIFSLRFRAADSAIQPDLGDCGGLPIGPYN